MSKLRNMIAQFMQGRYGQDELYRAMLVFYLILLVLDVFIKSIVLSIIISLCVIIIFFRFFSKNISARQKENAKYLTIKHKIKNGFSIFKKRLTDKDHVYRKCPECKATLRFPKKKGEHDAVCPKCHKPLKVKI